MQNLKPLGDKEMEGFTVLPIGGRACWYYVNCCLVAPYAETHSKWPMIVGGVGYSQNNLVKWFYLVPKNIDWDAYLDLYINGISRLHDIEKHTIKLREETVSKINVSDLQSLSDAELAELIHFYTTKFGELSHIAATLRFVDMALLNRLDKVLTDSDKKADIVRFISVTSEPSFSLKEELAVLDLAITVKDGSIKIDSDVYKEVIQKIKDSYCWTACGYYEEKPKIIEDYDRAVKENAEGDPEGKKKQIMDRMEEDKKHHQAAVENLNPEHKIFAEIAASSTHYKDLYKFSINKTIYFAEALFEEISQRTGKSVKDIKNLTPKEIYDLVLGTPFDENLLQLRALCDVLMAYPDHQSIYTGKDAQVFAQKYLVLEGAAQKEFKGRVASKGFIKGKACIVRSGAEFGKMKQGDVMVVINTSPDYVPIMHKAGAIVAEEGGLTAHVAVVSREFGIPCVVGIKRISEIIKDGDMLEVDAEKGIVKILN
jgi:phosphohistidine swiveling domain-containing protein